MTRRARCRGIPGGRRRTRRCGHPRPAERPDRGGDQLGTVGCADHALGGHAARPVAGFDAVSQGSEGALDLGGILGEDPLVHGDDRGRRARGGCGGCPVLDLVELDVGLPRQAVRGLDRLRACLRAEHEDARPPPAVLPLTGQVVAGEQDRCQLLDGRGDSALWPRGGRGRRFGVGITCPAGRQRQDRGGDHNHQGPDMQTHGTPPPSVRCHRVCTGAIGPNRVQSPPGGSRTRGAQPALGVDSPDWGQPHRERRDHVERVTRRARGIGGDSPWWSSPCGCRPLLRPEHAPRRTAATATPMSLGHLPICSPL